MDDGGRQELRRGVRWTYRGWGAVCIAYAVFLVTATGWILAWQLNYDGSGGPDIGSFLALMAITFPLGLFALPVSGIIDSVIDNPDGYGSFERGLELALFDASALFFGLLQVWLVWKLGRWAIRRAARALDPDKPLLPST